MIDQITISDMALKLPHTEASGHMGQADIRVKGKIFITFKDESWAVLKLTPDQQAMFLETGGDCFEPVKGGWGQSGWTRMRYETMKSEEIGHALQTAWRNVAQKRMIVAFDEENTQ